jgi:hypothetical protein
MKFYPLYISSFLFLSLLGCSKEHLTVYTDYLSIENLASYHVRTPDPSLNNPPLGQRLIISWSLSKKIFNNLENLHIDVIVRFRNREEDKFSIALYKASGTYIYYLLNKDYFEKKGILTYKLDLLTNAILIEKWRHQLWTDPIIFEKDE